MKLNIFFILTVLFSSYSYAAYDICEAKVLASLKTKDNPTPYYQVGDTISAITQYWFDVETQEFTLCQKGGGCYPQFISRNGKKIETLKLNKCVVGPVISVSSSTVEYSLIPDRKNISSSALRSHYVSNRLVSLGIGIAPAENAAEYYIKRPNSQCGKLVKQVLEGNPGAFNTLEQSPKYCKWDWNSK